MGQNRNMWTKQERRTYSLRETRAQKDIETKAFVQAYSR
jgi:hypothetical protein